MAYLILALPLISALICGIYNKKLDKFSAAKFASIMMIITAVISTMFFVKISIDNEITKLVIFPFIKIGDFQANWAIYIDQLSAIMIFIVTVVSSIVHVYSIGYMHDDENLARFMSYLSLFTFGMLMLVTSDNFLQLFFGWEAVGACSYLLIGFWYEKDSANNAAIKAFIVNRVGDFAFILGIIIAYYFYGSVNFIDIFPYTGDFATIELNILGVEFSLIEVMALLLFIGAMGKSAQIGLHVWLPDAMEGPTPVSALIHAATMVTAGVFLLARCSYIFEYAHNVKIFVTYIGAITCLFAAIIAVAQNDIKKIIAYSTCSQLGYMFISAGISEYQVGIFHLFTHAFFKAMLFLCAGSVIHACHEQDIRKMGGLMKKLPITYIFFWVGSLAIMGIPPFAGFYSKDLILIGALEDTSFHSNFAYGCGLIAAFCTAIYSTKIIVKVFHGDYKSVEQYQNAHEAPLVMNAPIYILLVGSIISGMIGKYILEINYFEVGYFKESIFVKEYKLGSEHALYIELIPAILAIFGMAVGYLMFSNKLSLIFARENGYVAKLVSNKFYFDEMYEKIFVANNFRAACIFNIFDRKVIDYIVSNCSKSLSVSLSHRIIALHNGFVNYYAISFLLGMMAILAFLILKFVV